MSQENRSLLQAFFAPLLWLLNAFRWLWLGLLIIGLPTWIYVAFIADEPVFAIEDDVELGKMSVESINQDPEQFPVLSREEYPEAYGHIDRIVGNLLSSPEIKYRDVFAYDQVKLIHQDDVLNAFCTPGGYIYVFTGLIHYLEAEDHLAGVLGHEIAHAELRHSSLRLQRELGTKKLLDLVILSPGTTLSGAAGAAAIEQLSSLSFSREQEAQADEWSVKYLATTPYACDATAGFFAKLLEEGDQEQIPAFLSDHPASSDRVTSIRNTAQALGCDTTLGEDQSQWKAFQASLPQPEEPEDGDR